MEEAKPEAEDSLLVERALDDGDAKVQGNRHRAAQRHCEAEADAGRHAVVLDVNPALHRTRVDEADQEDLVIGPYRHVILEAVEEEEITADVEAVDERANAAEV